MNLLKKWKFRHLVMSVSVLARGEKPEEQVPGSSTDQP